MKISFLLEEFCHHKKYLQGVSPASVTRYRNTINYFISNRKIVDIRDITKVSLREFFLYGSMERKWKPTTYRTHHMVLRSFLQWCMKENYLHENVIQDIELPRLPHNLPKALSKEEARRIMNTVASLPCSSHFFHIRNQLIFKLFLYTGVRKSELLGVMIHHIDMEKRQIRIMNGKGNKDRVIPLHHNLIPILKTYLELRKKRKVIIPELLVSKSKMMAFTKSGLKKLIERVKKASGIYFTAHMLRHTFATIMLESSSNIYSLSKILGHNDIKTTTIYLALQDKYMRSQIENYHFE